MAEVYIVVKEHSGGGLLIESVWSTRALAESARWYHAMSEGKESIVGYSVIQRDVNKAQKC